jgi:2-dehydropantoate 2-reductase
MLHRGLRVDSVSGDFVVHPVRATADPGTVGVVDAVIIAVKSWQLPDAASAVRPLLDDDTPVLPLLNGVEATDVLSEALGREHVLGGLCRIAAQIAGPGHIVHSAIEPSIILGELDNRRSGRARRLHGALIGAGVSSELATDIAAAIWEKFMLIATWSGIGAVTREPIGAWRAQPGTRSMAEACLREILSLARARGIALPEDQVERTLTFFDAIPHEGTASMQRDVVSGRPSELESQSGAVVRLGKAAGVPTPTHAFLYHSLLPQERAARGEG